MNETTAKLIDLLTASKMRAISFDLEIGTDALKYSAWCSALATAGIGLALSSWDKIAPACKWHRPGMGLLAVTVPLLVSVAIGASMNWQLNDSFSRKRQMMTLILKQQIILVADGNLSDSGRALGDKFLEGRYLNDEDQDNLKKLSTRERKSITPKKLIVWQQGAAALGYIIAVAITSITFLR